MLRPEPLCLVKSENRQLEFHLAGLAVNRDLRLGRAVSEV